MKVTVTTIPTSLHDLLTPEQRDHISKSRDGNNRRLIVQNLGLVDIEVSYDEIGGAGEIFGEGISIQQSQNSPFSIIDLRKMFLVTEAVDNDNVRIFGA